MIIGLAPMDGYTDCAFRQIVKEIFDVYGEKEKYELFLRTEFMNADGYVINPLGVAKHLITDKDQKNVIMQIFGSDENMLTKCFQDIEKKYGKIFSYIELNMGCPARNVMNTGGGSALMKDRKQSLALLKSLRKAVTMPISIKTRIGLDAQDIKKQFAFLVEASEYVDMISVHGRTTKQIYSGEVDRKFIYELKKQCNPKCKIIGNGGITSYHQAIDRARGIYTSYSDFDSHESVDELKKRGLITDGKYLPYDPLLQERARELRKHMTPAEKQVWKYCLKPLGINILRQKIIDHYITDFYIPSRKLVIEIDGDTHFNDEAKGYDEARTKILEAYGLEVLRVTNDEVYNHFEKICKLIESKITPNPSLAKRGTVTASSFAKGGGPVITGPEDSIIDGIMIGQAAIGNPRIFTPHIPSKKDVKETILKHLNYMVAYEQFFQKQKEKFTGTLAMPNIPKMLKKSVPPMVVVEFRKHLFQYLKGIPGSKDMKQKLSTITEYEPLVEAIQEFFG